MTEEVIDPNREALDLFDGWSRAIVSNDAGPIGAYMADEWIIVSPTGATTKQQFLAVVESGDLTHETFTFELERMRIYGDTMCVYGRVRNNGLFKGQPFTVDEWASDVFVNKDGRWLCVFSHITPVDPAKCN